MQTLDTEPSVFISYKNKDGDVAQKFCYELATTVQKLGAIRPFCTILAGSLPDTADLQKTIVREAKVCACAIVIFTPNYMKSRYCKLELEKIRKKFKEKFLLIRIGATMKQTKKIFKEHVYHELKDDPLSGDKGLDELNLITKCLRWMSEEVSKKETTTESFPVGVSYGGSRDGYLSSNEYPAYKIKVQSTALLVKSNDERRHFFPHIVCHYEKVKINSISYEMFNKLFEKDWAEQTITYWERTEELKVKAFKDTPEELFSRVNVIAAGHISPWLTARIPKFVKADEDGFVGVLALAVLLTEKNGLSTSEIAYWEKNDERESSRLKLEKLLKGEANAG